MTIWEIKTNSGLYYVANKSQEQIRKRMYVYLREWVAQGNPLSTAVYCYCPLTVRHSLP